MLAPVHAIIIYQFFFSAHLICCILHGFPSFFFIQRFAAFMPLTVTDNNQQVSATLFEAVADEMGLTDCWLVFLGWFYAIFQSPNEVFSSSMFAGMNKHMQNNTWH